MVPNQRSVSLSENDYLAILDVITQFHKCTNQDDLQETFRAHLFPLLEASSGIYAWTDRDIGKLQIMGAINIPESGLQAFEEFVKTDRLSGMLVTQGRPVLAYDIDRPREDLVEEAKVFFRNPKYKRKDNPYITQIKTALLAVEVPEPTIGIGIHRLPPLDKPWTYRDVRILELLRPHVLNTIKTILLTAELAKYQTLAEALTDVPTPIALFTEDYRLIFHNPTFSNFFDIRLGELLPANLVTILRREIAEYDPPFDTSHSKPRIPFYQLPQGVFRLSLTCLARKGPEDSKLWLLKLHSAVELYSKVNKLMQDAGLTNREMEVCSLVRDGVTDRGIAERLFISLNTTKNHVKHIHQKLGVHTRGALVSLLRNDSSLIA